MLHQNLFIEFESLYTNGGSHTLFPQLLELVQNVTVVTSSPSSEERATMMRFCKALDIKYLVLSEDDPQEVEAIVSRKHRSHYAQSVHFLFKYRSVEAIVSPLDGHEL